MSNRRDWTGDEWQAFAHQLVQRRHGPENVQEVPDTVAGDAGLEFFTTCGCVYQCYAPQEVSDVAKAASAMKAKAARDLRKVEVNEIKIKSLLAGIEIRRWILLCPFLDNKDVVSDVRKRGLALKGKALSILSPSFEAFVQSQVDFASELAQLRALSLGPSLSLTLPTATAISTSATQIGSKIDQKLERAFGSSASSEQISAKRNAYVKAQLYRENALEQLRRNHPILWDRAYQTLEAEELRLVAAGAAINLPLEQLQISTDRIEASLTRSLPDLQGGIITHIALGTVSDWLIRCPLDFPGPSA